MKNERIQLNSKNVAPLFNRLLSSVRDDMSENPYIIKAIKVLPMQHPKIIFSRKINIAA